ncbi:unnamed protein product [Orchesella dallaii]|uniref:Protein kinase domain-containing protein n=1 Tax=Orchesella dallaii TaxID=48710 RepID=A0ABP1QRE3_9HEXA
MISTQSVNLNMNTLIVDGSFGTVLYKRKIWERVEVVTRAFLHAVDNNASLALLLTNEILGHHDWKDNQLMSYFFCNEEVALVLTFFVPCSMALTQYIKERIIGIPPVEILRQVTIGMEWLHDRKIVHGDLNPNTIQLSSRFFNVKISGNSNSKPSGSRWVAPELLLQANEFYSSKCTYSSDIYALGLVYYYVLTDGKHAFEQPYINQDNITGGNASNEPVHLKHTCSQNIVFIDKMTSKDPLSRLSISELLSCPIFWPKNRRIQFLEQQHENRKDMLQQLTNNKNESKKKKPPIPKKPLAKIKSLYANGGAIVNNGMQAEQNDQAPPNKLRSVRNLINRFSVPNLTDTPPSPDKIVQRRNSENSVKKIADLFLNSNKAEGTSPERKITPELDIREEQELNLDVLTILQTIKTRNLQIIKRTLEKLAKHINLLEIWDEKQKSLLHVAVKCREYGVVEYLINDQKFSSMLSKETFKTSIVHDCMWDIHEITEGEFVNKCKILQLLFKIQPELIKSRDECERTPLHIACLHSFQNEQEQYQLIDMLLKNNANVKSKGWEDMTPLHLVLKREPLAGNVFDMIKLLIENHSVPDTLFLQLLCVNGNPKLFHKTVEYLVSTGQDELLKGKIEDLLQKSRLNAVSCQTTILHCAVWCFEVLPETLDIFKSLDFDFNYEDFDGDSVLNTAFRAGRRVSLLKTLILCGADPKFLNDIGMNFLHRSAFLNNLSYLELFVEECDVNAKTDYGDTPLHYLFAGWTYTIHDCVSLLLDHGAVVNVKNKNGETVIDQAKRALERGKTGQRTIDLLLKSET